MTPAPAWLTSSFVALSLGTLLGTARCQQQEPLDLPALLGRLGDVHWLHRPPQPGERTVQFSSYDRKSDRGPGDAAEWYANDDRGQYVRTVERDGQKEFVLCDTDGPGVVSRIWSANPSGKLFFDVDGARVWTVDFAELCSGALEPVVEPLAGMRSRGGNCYLPIAFQQHLVVSASAGDLYYHVDVWYPPQGTRVVPFAPEQLERHGDAFAAATFALVSRVRGGEQSAQHEDVDAEQERVAAVAAGKVVRAVRVHWHEAPEGDLGERLRQVLLVVRCGAEETVRVPVLDFFGGGPEWQLHHGAFLGVGEGGAYCRWPMPMPEGGEVRLVNDGAERGWLPQLSVETEDGARTDDLLFRASFHLEKGFPSRPFRDFLVLDAVGAGRFVGTALIVKNPHRAWWGEGDEKFWVDGEKFPSTFGTGTEDYFGYAWCCPEPFSSAFHGQPECDGPDNYGFTAVHRMHVLDSVPFARSFRFDLEVWHWVPGLAIDYATVAYWYGARGARSGLPDVPPAAARTLERLPEPPVLVVAGALEGEQLRVTACSGGKHEVQATWFVQGAFSRDNQLWWMDGKPGDTLQLAVPVAKTGRYRVKAAFAKARDYGIVQCALAGHDVGAPIDLYAPEVTASGALELGIVELPAGDATFALRLTGHNEHAEPRHMVGLDYLLLEPVQ